MARTKFLVYVLVAAAVALVGLMKLSGRAADVARLEADERLGWGKTLFETSGHLAQAYRRDALTSAAADPAVAQGFSDPAAAPAVAGKAIVAALGKLPPGLRGAGLLLVATDSGVAFLAPNGAPASAPAGWPPAALDGALQAGVPGVKVLANGKLWQVAGVAVHGAENKVVGRLGAAFPIDDAYAVEQAKDLGLGVTLVAGDFLASSLPAEQRTKAQGVTAGNESVPLALTDSPSMGPLTLPIMADGAAFTRARSFPLANVEGGRVVLTSDSTVIRELAQFQQSAIFGLAGLLVLAIPVLLLLGGASQPAPAPQTERVAPKTELVETQPLPVRAEPEFPLSSSTATTSPLTEPVAVAPPPAPLEEAEPEPITGSAITEPPPEATSPLQAESPFELPPPSKPSSSSGAQVNGLDMVALPPPDPQPFHSAQNEEVTAAQKVLDPFALAAAQLPPEDEAPLRSESTVVAAVPEQLLRATTARAAPKSNGSPGAGSAQTVALPSPSGPPPSDNPEEVHFQDVFNQFVATRSQCNEPADGLTYEKFAAKLRKNKESLVQKYNCKTVKFQVYVKEGKAALKATPVKE